MSQQLHTALLSATVTIIIMSLASMMSLAPAFAQNTPPMAFDDNTGTLEDVPVNIVVLGNDVDSESGLTIENVTDPTNGAVTLELDNTVTYTPDVDFFGTDSFEYTVSDGEDESTAMVTITIDGVNDHPSAEDDSDSTPEDTPVMTNVTSNDFDIDGDTLRVTEVSTPPDNGIATVNDNGTITYTPNPDFSGTDSYTYSLFDTGLTDTAVVTISVASVNDAPIAQAQMISTNEDTSVSITLTATDADGDSLTFIAAPPPSFGDLSGLEPDLIYTPHADFSGTDSFSFLVEDGELGSNAAIIINVTSVNDPPAALDDKVETAEDIPVRINVLSNDTDVESDPLNMTGTTDPANGSVEFGANGTLTYAPDVNFNGIDTFEYTLSDGNFSDTGTVVVNITATNDVPVASNDSQTTEENTAATTSVLANDNDPDGDPLQVGNVIQPAHGSATIDPDGTTITYSPNSGFAGQDAYAYFVSDGKGGVDQAIVTLTVTETQSGNSGGGGGRRGGGGGGGGSSSFVQSGPPQPTVQIVEDSFFELNPLAKILMQNVALQIQGTLALQPTSIGQQVAVATDLQNPQGSYQSYAYMVQITDKDGYTVGIEMSFGTLSPGSIANDVAVQWTPMVTGDYKMQVFVWDALTGTPVALSETTTKTLAVI